MGTTLIEDLQITIQHHGNSNPESQIPVSKSVPDSRVQESKKTENSVSSDDGRANWM